MINLERIDPNIIRQVQEQTIKEIVHPQREAEIAREEKGEKGHYTPEIILKYKKKVKKYNGLLKRKKISIFLTLEKEDGESLILSIYERKTDELLQVFHNETAEEMLMKLESFLGLFVDNRI